MEILKVRKGLFSWKFVIQLMFTNVRIRDKVAFIRDPGHRTFFRNCPGQSGTVGTYALTIEIYFDPINEDCDSFFTPLA